MSLHSIHSLRARLDALAAKVPVPPDALPILGPFPLLEYDDAAGALVHVATATWDRQSRRWREVAGAENTEQ